MPLLTPRRACFAVFGVLVLPVILAIWCVPWFVTQDGPSHAYNAHILIELSKPHSPFEEFYTARLEPLPNLAGHLLLVGLMSILSARTADRVMMTITFVGFASSVVWLRWRVAGWKGITLVVPLAVILALNLMWLFGFYNFLLGACLFPVTLGFWWAGRERMGLSRALTLAGLLVIGYLCHLVSLGLTVVGLMVLALTTPGPGWRRRCCWTSVSLAPLIPLGIMYHGMMRANGETRPYWNLSDVWSLRKWIRHLLSADPLQLMSGTGAFPFVEEVSPWFRLLSPTLLVALALVVLAAATFFVQREQGQSFAGARRPWVILALLFLAVWLIGPDGLGERHGGFLRERILLLGLVAIVPALELDARKIGIRVGAAALMAAAVLQLAATWDYALTSNRLARDFMRVEPHVGVGRRIKILLVGDYDRFKANPLLHTGNMFGIGTGNVVWDNYEVAQYFFPAKYRDDLADRRTRAKQAQRMYRFMFPFPDDVAGEDLDKWADLLAQAHHEIDVLVVWGSDPRLDAINMQWFGPEPTFEQANVRIFRHR